MLSTRSLMATLLVLVPVTGSPVLGHLLVLWEVWPGHILEYQQVSVPAAKNYSCKTSGNVILDQSTQKRGIRNYSGFRTNLKTSRKNAYRNYQHKILLKYVILYKRNPYPIADGSISVHISRKHLGRSELILRRKNYLRHILRNILNRKCDGYEVKVNWHSILNGARKKSETKRKEQLQITYFENRHKPLRAGSLLGYIACQTNMMLNVKEAYFQKDQEGLQSIVIKLVKPQIPRGKVLTEAEVLRKKKSKSNSNRIFTSVKENVFSKENTNIYNKEQFRMTDGKKILNVEWSSPYMGFKKYGQFSKSFHRGTSFPIRENIKLQKWKTRTKNSMNANEKFRFIHAFTYQRSSASKQKMFSAHEPVMPNIQQIKESAFQIKMYRTKKLIKLAKWLRAKENKLGGNGIEVLSTIYYVQPSLISPTFPAIKTAVGVKNEVFTSERDEAKASVYMTKMLKYLMQPSKRIKKKYLRVAHKGFRISPLKALMVRKHLDTEESLPILLYLFKHIFKGPSVVERTKRSAKAETVPISVDVLTHVTSALIACATIFGLALFTLALAACYLYYNRSIKMHFRQFGPFLEAGLKGEESKKEWKHTASQCCPPISVSQNFHFGQPQESRKNQILATATKTCPKEEFVIMKEIYGSSDTEGSSEISCRGLTIRSRAIVLPSRSSDSIQSLFDVRDDVRDDVSSQQSMTMENASSTVPPKNDLVPVPQQPDNQEQSTSKDVSPKLKKTTISESKPDNDLARSSKALQGVQPDHCLYDVKEPSTSKDVALKKPAISEPKPDSAITGPSSTEASQTGQTQAILKSEPGNAMAGPSSTEASQTGQAQAILKSEPGNAMAGPSSTEASQTGQAQAILKSEPGNVITGPSSTEASQAGQTQAILKSEPGNTITGPSSTEASQAGQTQAILKSEPGNAMAGPSSTEASQAGQTQAILKSEPGNAMAGPSSTEASQAGQTQAILKSEPGNAITGPSSTEASQTGQAQAILKSEPGNAITGPSSTEASQAGQTQAISNTGLDNAVIGIFSTTVSQVDQALAISMSETDNAVIGLYSTTVSQVDQALIISTPALDNAITGPFSTEVSQSEKTQNILKSEPDNAIIPPSSTTVSQVDQPLTKISTEQNP
ncbi:uncharacterized protein LOC117047888 [Lacerta agilis]|uniref:uncharacterized protein LOC117047888 n=1 Tax=Lacerta agilis TaxID=80427 RepID=UPI00141A0961|nr:uncharacterized protein LOC117047888 [Lacerta agilis]